MEVSPGCHIAALRGGSGGRKIQNYENNQMQHICAIWRCGPKAPNHQFDSIPLSPFVINYLDAVQFFSFQLGSRVVHLVEILQPAPLRITAAAIKLVFSGLVTAVLKNACWAAVIIFLCGGNGGDGLVMDSGARWQRWFNAKRSWVLNLAFEYLSDFGVV